MIGATVNIVAGFPPFWERGMEKKELCFSKSKNHLPYFGGQFCENRRRLGFQTLYSTGNDSVSREKQIISGRVGFKFSQFQFEINNNRGLGLSYVIHKKITVYLQKPMTDSIIKYLVPDEWARTHWLCPPTNCCHLE